MARSISTRSLGANIARATSFAAILIVGAALGACTSNQGVASAPGSAAPEIAAEAPPPEQADAPVAAESAAESPAPAGNIVVIASTAAIAETYPIGRRLSSADRICLKAGDDLTLLLASGTRKFAGPGCFQPIADQRRSFAAIASRRNGSRVRTGATRGAGTASPRMVVIRGDAQALAFYPKGRRVAVSARICLPEGADYLTFQRSDGGLVTYGGGGCNKQAEEPRTDPLRTSGSGSGP